MHKERTSISALGVRAETESIQMRSIAPDLHIRSATEITKDISQNDINYINFASLSAYQSH